MSARAPARRRALRLGLIGVAMGAGVSGCSAHDVVKPNIDEEDGGRQQSDGGGADRGDAADPGVPSADCNLTGIWFTKIVSVSQALNLPQYANSWYYVEIDQPAGSGEFTITKEIDCGVEVRGSATVTLLPATLEAHMKHNSQAGRKGMMKKAAGARCVVDAETFWVLLGAADRFLPPRNTAEEIATVAARLPLPTPDRPDGVEDWDNDGKPGVAWQISGLLQGTRHTVQRQWNRWFTTERYGVTPSTSWNEIVVGLDFDKDETIFEPTSGPLLAPSFSVRTPETPNRYVMRFLGRDRNDARAAVIRGTDPEGATAATVETCHALQDALPAEDQ